MCLRRWKPQQSFHITSCPVEEWQDKIKKAKKAQDFQEFLVSDLELSDKARILSKVRDKKGFLYALFNDTEGVERLEAFAERAGQFKVAQLLRFFLYHVRTPDTDEMEWCQGVVTLDILSRWFVQKEIYIQERLRALHKELDLGPATAEKEAEIRSKIRRGENILEGLEKENRRVQEFSWILEGAMPGGPLRRGFTAWRKDPNWYLCDWLRQDCAGRGGCCGRNCGCCEKPRNTHRGHKRGHCTSICPCCIHSRDHISCSKTPTYAGNIESIQVDLITGKSMYNLRMHRAYIWGLDVLSEVD